MGKSINSVISKISKKKLLSKTSRRTESINKDFMPEVNKNGIPKSVRPSRRAIDPGASTVLSKDIWFVVSCAKDNSIYVVDCRSQQAWPAKYVEKYPNYTLQKRQLWSQGEKHYMKVQLVGQKTFKACRIKIMAVADSKPEADIIWKKPDPESASFATTHGQSVYVQPGEITSDRKRKISNLSDDVDGSDVDGAELHDSDAESHTSAALDDLESQFNRIIEKCDKLEKKKEKKDKEDLDYIPEIKSHDSISPKKKKRKGVASTPKARDRNTSGDSNVFECNFSEDDSKKSGNTPTGSPGTPFNKSAITDLSDNSGEDSDSDKDTAKERDEVKETVPELNKTSNNVSSLLEQTERSLETPPTDKAQDVKGDVLNVDDGVNIFVLPPNMSAEFFDAIKLATGLAIFENLPKISGNLRSQMIPAITETLKNSLKDIVEPLIKDYMDVAMKPVMSLLQKANKNVEKSNALGNKTLLKVTKIHDGSKVESSELIQLDVNVSKVELFKPGAITVTIKPGKVVDFTPEINDIFDTKGKNPSKFFRLLASEMFGTRNLRFYRMCEKSDNKADSLWIICPELMAIFDRVARRYIAIAMVPQETKRLHHEFRQLNSAPSNADIESEKDSIKNKIVTFTNNIMKAIYPMMKTFGGDAGRTQYKSQSVWYWRLIAKSWKPRAEWKISHDVVNREYYCMKRDRQNRRVTKAQYVRDYKAEGPGNFYNDLRLKSRQRFYKRYPNLVGKEIDSDVEEYDIIYDRGDEFLGRYMKEFF